jgi:MoxR-like ATPase
VEQAVNLDSYTPILEIRDVEDFRHPGDFSIHGDRRDGRLYRYTPGIKLAVNVALATGRPLLVLGATGCGKSSMANNLARVMRRRYYEFVVTSRSQARDLLYRFDAVRRLGDSQSRNHRKPPLATAESTDQIWQTQFPYVDPGPMWWSLDRRTASRRGYPGEGTLPFRKAVDPVIWEPDASSIGSSVLLIDEIDKAEPDFPNNLLVPLGSWQFIVDEVATPIYLPVADEMQHPTLRPLVIITSNRERELADTFLRRCVVLEIPTPTPDQLVQLAVTTFGRPDDGSFQNIAHLLLELRGVQNLSIAEFLDAVSAIERLQAAEPTLSEIIKLSAWRSSEV